MTIAKKRLLMAAFFSPLTIPILFFLGEYFLSGFTNQGVGYIDKLFQLTIVFALESYFFTFVLGGPLLFVLKRLNKVNFFNCVVFSLILGIASGACFSIFFNDSLAIGVFAFLGGISAFIISIVFCIILGIGL